MKGGRAGLIVGLILVASGAITAGAQVTGTFISACVGKNDALSVAQAPADCKGGTFLQWPDRQMFDTTVAHLQGQIDALRAQNVAQDAAINDLRTKVDDHEIRITGLRTDVNDHEIRITDIRTKVDGHELRITDLERRVRRLETPPTTVTFTQVARGPTQLVSDGIDVWVTNYYGDPGQEYRITKLRGTDGTNLGSFPVGYAFPWGITFDGTYLWTANYGGQNLARIRPSDGAVIGTVAVLEPHPFYVVYFDGVLWVGGWDTNQVQAIRPSDGSTRCTIATGFHHPTRPAFDGIFIWIADWGGADAGRNANTLRKIRASDCTEAPESPIVVGTNPRNASFDGTHVWVANNGDNTVSKIRPADGVVVATYPVGQAPIGVAVDGQQVWVGNSASATVSRLRATDGLLIETVNVGQNPAGILVANGFVWVANFDSNTVARFAIGSAP